MEARGKSRPSAGDHTAFLSRDDVRRPEHPETLLPVIKREQGGPRLRPRTFRQARRFAPDSRAASRAVSANPPLAVDIDIFAIYILSGFPKGVAAELMGTKRVWFSLRKTSSSLEPGPPSGLILPGKDDETRESR